MKMLKFIDKDGNEIKKISSEVMNSPDELRKILQESGCTLKEQWKLTFDQAVCFSKVAASIFHQNLNFEINKINMDFFSPFVVNSIFSIELYLKCIHQKHQTKSLPEVSDKHNLKNLFFSLPGKIQNNLQKSLEACLIAHGCTDQSMDLGKKMRSLANAYVEWRYVHEKGHLKIQGFNYLIPIMSAFYNSSIDIEWYKKA